jgi:hypothetical protein
VLSPAGADRRAGTTGEDSGILRCSSSNSNGASARAHVPFDVVGQHGNPRMRCGIMTANEQVWLPDRSENPVISVVHHGTSKPMVLVRLAVRCAVSRSCVLPRWDGPETEPIAPTIGPYNHPALWWTGRVSVSLDSLLNKGSPGRAGRSGLHVVWFTVWAEPVGGSKFKVFKHEPVSGSTEEFSADR